jgi:S1-C subfamily serine protease
VSQELSAGFPIRRGWHGRAAAALLIGVSAVALAFALVERGAGFVLPTNRLEDAGAVLDEKMGATVERLDAGTARDLGISPREPGLVVTSLAADGPAAEAGVHASDVIVRIGATSVASEAAAAAALQQARPPYILMLNRRGQYAMVRLPMSRGPAGQGGTP